MSEQYTSNFPIKYPVTISKEKVERSAEVGNLKCSSQGLFTQKSGSYFG